MPFQRTGTCNRCGQCCGADGSPNQANPFPSNWPDALRHWSLDDINELCPQLSMCGLSQLGEDLVGVPPGDEVGLFRVTGKPHYYVWVPGAALCKDTSAAHDGSSYSLECPFLANDPGDGSRPCALVGSNDDGAYLKFCYPEGPLEFATQAMVDQWQTDHPLCSHDWVEL